jgi:hypothetical protein
VLHKRSDVLPALVVANIREIAMSRSTGLMRPRYESVFTHSGPKAVVEARAITLTGIEEQSQIRLL